MKKVTCQRRILVVITGGFLAIAMSASSVLARRHGTHPHSSNSNKRTKADKQLTQEDLPIVVRIAPFTGDVNDFTAHLIQDLGAVSTTASPRRVIIETGDSSMTPDEHDHLPQLTITGELVDVAAKSKKGGLLAVLKLSDGDETVGAWAGTTDYHASAVSLARLMALKVISVLKVAYPPVSRPKASVGAPHIRGFQKHRHMGGISTIRKLDDRKPSDTIQWVVGVSSETRRTATMVEYIGD